MRYKAPATETPLTYKRSIDKPEDARIPNQAIQATTKSWNRKSVRDMKYTTPNPFSPNLVLADVISTIHNTTAVRSPGGCLPLTSTNSPTINLLPPTAAGTAGLNSDTTPPGHTPKPPLHKRPPIQPRKMPPDKQDSSQGHIISTPPSTTWHCPLNFTAPTCAVTISGADGLPVELMDFYIEETSSAPNEGSQEAEATPGGKSTGPKP